MPGLFLLGTMKKTNDNGLTLNDREALRIYSSLLKQRQEGTLPSAAVLGGDTFRLPRVRLAGDIDFSKAKRSCKRCHGTGVQGHRLLKDDRGEIRVPIVCPCVVEAGGVKQDKLDQIMGGAR